MRTGVLMVIGLLSIAPTADRATLAVEFMVAARHPTVSGTAPTGLLMRRVAPQVAMQSYASAVDAFRDGTKRRVVKGLKIRLWPEGHPAAMFIQPAAS